MAYTDPQSIHNPATGTAAPASWGDTVRDDLQWFAVDKPRCKVRDTNATQNATNGGATTITFNTEVYDVGGCHSTVSNTSRLTVPSGGGGLYAIGGSLWWDSNTSGTRALQIAVNGTTIAGISHNASTGTTRQALTVDHQLAAGDYVELTVFQDSGSTRTITGNQTYTPILWFRWVANTA